MLSYKCRVIKPYISIWKTQEAITPEEAAHSYHWNLPISISRARWKVVVDDNSHYYIHFALIEVEGYGEWISRIYHHGIWRKGGVVDKIKPKLEDVAKAIGWEGDPQELLEPGWEYEEEEKE